MSKGKFETSVCSFVRSVDPSIGVFTAHAERGGQGVPVMVRKEGFLGQVSPFKPAKGKENSPGANLPGTHHVCRMPDDRGVLRISGRVRFIAASTAPAMCDNPKFVEAVSDLFDKAAIRDESGHSVLERIAGRYLWNLLNGRFAWRNRFSATDQRATLTVRTPDGVLTLESDPLRYDLTKPLETPEALAAGIVSVKTDQENPDPIAVITAVRDAIAEALTRPNRAVLVDFAWDADVGPGATVYPSQAYVEEKTSISKLLLTVGTDDPIRNPGRAIMSDQKVGAALRYFDDWHGQGPVVPVNPYAGDKASQVIFRAKTNKPHKAPNPTLYDLILSDAFMEGTIEYDLKGLPEDIAARNIAFVLSCFIRGGLFQTKGGAETSGGQEAEADEAGGDDE